MKNQLLDHIDPTNAMLAYSILFEDPINGEELRPSEAPFTHQDGESMVLLVENKDGNQKWKHTILTEEI